MKHVIPRKPRYNSFSSNLWFNFRGLLAGHGLSTRPLPSLPGYCQVAAAQGRCRWGLQNRSMMNCVCHSLCQCHDVLPVFFFPGLWQHTVLIWSFGVFRPWVCRYGRVCLANVSSLAGTGFTQPGALRMRPFVWIHGCVPEDRMDAAQLCRLMESLDQSWDLS